WCLFQIDGRSLAIALSAVAEVIEAEQLVHLPLCSDQVLGVCTYRRDLLPVIALGRAPASAAGSAAGRPVVLILRGEHASWGVQIDRGMASVAQGPLDEPGALAAGPDGGVVSGTITRGDTTHLVLDAEATWRRVREAVEGWYKGDRGEDQQISIGGRLIP